MKVLQNISTGIASNVVKFNAHILRITQKSQFVC